MENYELFFKKALAIQAQKQAKLTEKEKKEIALSLGFSEADWQAVSDTAQACFERGREFLRRNNYAKAIPELQEAVIILPENPEVLAHLAETYLAKFEREKRKIAQEKALQYAHECLQYAPMHSLAHQVIDFFNPHKKRTSAPQPSFSAYSNATPKKEKKQEKSISSFLVGVIIVACLCLFAFPFYGDYLFSNFPKKSQKYAKTTAPQPKPHNSSSTNTLKKDTLPVAWDDLPQNLRNKGYIWLQKNNNHWALKKQNGAEILQMHLKTNLWQHQKRTLPTGKSKEYYTYVAVFQVEMQCDSIQIDKALLKAEMLDMNGQTVVFAMDSLNLGRGSYATDMPADYVFRQGETAELFFSYTSESPQKYPALHKKPEKLWMSCRFLQTVAPEKKEIPKPIQVSIRKEYNSENAHTLQFSTLKERYFYSQKIYAHAHIWLIEVKNTHPTETLTRLDSSVLIKYKNGKTSDVPHLIFYEGEKNAYIPPKSSRVFRLVSYLGDIETKEGVVYAKPEDVKSIDLEIVQLYWAKGQ
jgi:tetratricopeptide (TPR) repeat protein